MTHQQKKTATATTTIPQPKLTPEVEARLAELWKLAYGSSTQEDLRQLYKQWADSYDEDHEAIGFFGHLIAAKLLAKHLNHLDPENARILDAGAGTGAAGVALHQLGFRELTGVDLSPDMLARAEQKGVYKTLFPADLGFPIDDLPTDSFDAAILVGVFSYGQAPNYALDEILRVVKPGGLIVFTMRTDFFESDAMWVRSKIQRLEEKGMWDLVELTKPEPYLPNKDPEAMFRVWCYRALEGKRVPVDHAFGEAVREVFSNEAPVKRLDHRYIWNSVGSRLYDQYIDQPEYYLVDCEEEILRDNSEDILGPAKVVVELGCGSARKVSHLLAAADVPGRHLEYVPIDLSEGALVATREQIEAKFGERITVDPHNGCMADILPQLRDRTDKVILFFGSAVGNFESIPETIDFLRTVRDSINVGDRFVVGIDLHKDEEILLQAYGAGEANRAFFLNMIRRMNNVLGGEFDLTQFHQATTYDLEGTHEGIEDRCVHFKMATRVPQTTRLKRIGVHAHLNAGDAIQVGVSRKYRREDIAKLAAAAGLRLNRQWLDQRGYFSLNEMVRDPE